MGFRRNTSISCVFHFLSLLFVPRVHWLSMWGESKSRGPRAHSSDTGWPPSACVLLPRAPTPLGPDGMFLKAPPGGSARQPGREPHSAVPRPSGASPGRKESCRGVVGLLLFILICPHLYSISNDQNSLPHDGGRIKPTGS